jgi:AsmA protein
MALHPEGAELQPAGTPAAPGGHNGVPARWPRPAHRGAEPRPGRESNEPGTQHAMKIWLRRVLIGLAVLLAVTIAALAWLVASFDPNRYKGVAIDWMKNQRNRTLAIDGPIRLSVFPRIEVQVSKVALSERGRAERFAAIDEAALAVQLMPLLRKQLVVDRVTARGVSVVYTRDAKGVRNIDDLVAPAEPAKAPGGSPPPEAGGAPVSFDVSRVELANVRASVRDDLIPLRGDIVLESLVTGRLADKIESPVELKVQLALQEPAVKGQLSGSTRLAPDLATGSVKLAGMQLNWRGDVPGASAVDTTLKGNLAYGGAKGAVQASELDLSLAATAGTIKVAGTTLKAARFEFDPARKAMTVANLQLHAAATQARENLALDLDWPGVTVTGDSLQGSALTGRVAVSGTHALEGKFQTAAPSGNFDLMRIPGFVLSLQGKSGPRSVDGKLGADLLVRAGQPAVNVEKLALQAKIVEPSLQPLALDLGGSLGASAKDAQWTLAGKLNDNQFSTEGRARFADKVPHLNVQARFDALDLNKVLGAATAQEAPAQAASAPAPADTPVQMAGLDAVQGQFALRAGSLVFRQYRVDDAVLDATLEAGVLKVTKLHGRAWGGTVDASGFADSRSSKLGVKLAASSVNIQSMLKSVADKDLLEGTGRVTADLQTSGKTVGELRSRLAGNAAVQLRDGAVKGVNLAQSLRRAKVALGASQDTVEQAKQTEKTDFSEMSASFQVADGVARSSDLDAKSPFLRLAGTGSADIGRGLIDYTARATVANTSKGQEGAELEALKGVTVPVLLSGPFEAISWKIQWSAIAANLAKTRAGEKLKDQEDKLKDRLKDKLGLPKSSTSAPAAAASGASAAAAPATPKDKLKDKLKGLLK